MNVFGIDVGTSQSVVSTVRDDYVETLPKICPNVCVYNDKCRVYKFSTQCSVSSLQTVVRISKKLQDLETPTKIIYDGKIKSFSPAQMISTFLFKCHEIIESSNYDIIKPINIALTVPSYFENEHRSVYYNASSLIPEFNLVALVNECTALAYAYGVQVFNMLEEEINSQYVLFVDSGSHTTVTLVYYKANEIQIVYSAQNPLIGGDTLNDVLYTELLNELKEHGYIESPTYIQKQQLLAYCEEIKIQLNNPNKQAISLQINQVDKMKDYLFVYSREKLNSIIESYGFGQHLLELINYVLNTSGITLTGSKNVARIVLYGGNMKLLSYINKIELAYKTHIDHDWNDNSRISQGLMYYLSLRDTITCIEMLPSQSLTDMSEFHPVHMKVSEYIYCNGFEAELRNNQAQAILCGRKNSNQFTYKVGDRPNHLSTPKSYFTPKLFQGSSRNQQAPTLQARVVTVDETYSEDFMKTVQERLELLEKKKVIEKEKKEKEIKNSHINRIVGLPDNLRNAVVTLTPTEAPKKDANCPFLFDSVFAASYKDSTPLSNFLNDRGEVYEKTESFQKSVEKKEKAPSYPVIPNKPKLLNLDSSLTSKLNDSLNKTYGINKKPIRRPRMVNDSEASSSLNYKKTPSRLNTSNISSTEDKRSKITSSSNYDISPYNNSGSNLSKLQSTSRVSNNASPLKSRIPPPQSNKSKKPSGLVITPGLKSSSDSNNNSGPNTPSKLGTNKLLLKPRESARDLYTYNIFMEQLKKNIIELYYPSRRTSCDKVVSVYREAAKSSNADYSDIMSNIIRELSKEFMALAYMMKYNLSSKKLLNELLEFLRNIKGHKGKITNLYYQKCLGLQLKDSVILIEDYCRQYPEISQIFNGK